MSTPSLARNVCAILIAAALPMISACGDTSDTAEPAVSSSQPATSAQTLATVLAGTDDLDTFSQAINRAELSGIFDGQGSYTLLAPDDEAFAKLGDKSAALMKDDQRAVLVALLRDHILPGHLTPDAIEKAIADNGGPVTISTLGEEQIKFAKEGDDLTATNEAGVKAQFDDDAKTAANGVIIPIDTVLLPADGQ